MANKPQDKNSIVASQRAAAAARNLDASTADLSALAISMVPHRNVHVMMAQLHAAVNEQQGESKVSRIVFDNIMAAGAPKKHTTHLGQSIRTRILNAIMSKSTTTNANNVEISQPRGKKPEAP